MGLGYCDYHEEELDESTFEYKGCWTCFHFQQTENVYFTVSEVATKNNVSPKTIYRWIKKGILEAQLFTMGRKNTNLPKKFYAIYSTERKEVKGSKNG